MPEASNGNSSVFSSFRDPDGFLFRKNGSLYRQINRSYQAHYEQLKNSGLLEKLQDQKLLVGHTEITDSNMGSDDSYLVIQPECIPTITYPYEWCFSQLQDAALLTLQIQKIAMSHGMSLKDASAYNIQFRHGKPVMIDTLSFEKSEHNRPWVAYRQFCQHFLAPLAVMSYLSPRLNPLSKIFLDGVPLDLASALLPSKSYLRPALTLHIHLHSKIKNEGAANQSAPAKMNANSIYGILDSLEKSVSTLRSKKNKEVWSNYYSSTHNYTDKAIQDKESLVRRYLEIAQPKTVWDMGSNTGRFSQIAAEKSEQVLSMDFDPDCVEINYREGKKNQNTRVLPLVFDLTNPSPGIGWSNQERTPIEERSQPDLIMALALIHHLAISGNLPLKYIAQYFNKISQEWLIIEFVPKSDPQTQKLLRSRNDIFNHYTQEDFETTFQFYFAIKNSVAVGDSGRTLFLMKKLDSAR